ncbi:hypothetical protein BU15DRAFT_64137 [Melanogaster broomeanus]|nr:hypothetical protein BU15DRAFT_64137 [Melanogaster broomeanus]
MKGEAHRDSVLAASPNPAHYALSALSLPPYLQAVAPSYCRWSEYPCTPENRFSAFKRHARVGRLTTELFRDAWTFLWTLFALVVALCWALGTHQPGRGPTIPIRSMDKFTTYACPGAQGYPATGYAHDVAEYGGTIAVLDIEKP